MHIDFLESGPLSFVLPVALIVAAIFAMGQILHGRYAGVISMVLVGTLFAVGFFTYAGAHDRAALISAISQRYGVTLSDSQAGTLMENHSYVKNGPDLTVASDHGVAKPYGTITASIGGERKRLMMYEVDGALYLGDVGPSAGAKVRELPVGVKIPALN